MQKALSLRSYAFTFLIALAMSVLPFAARAATTGTVQGVVKSTTGAPLAGAQVLLVETKEIARTDAGGNYAFTGEDPGRYTIQVTYASYKTVTLTTTVVQDVPQRLDFSLERVTVGGTGRIASAPPVPRTTTATVSVITAQEEQRVKSQPNNLYQFPGLLFGQPGITYDPGGYVHIRGSDLFQVGFQLDGISIIDPITNEFGTNLVTVGLKSANFYTNGADASYGGATGGFINEITSSGRDLHAQGVKGITEVTVGPGNSWRYTGTNTQIGDVIDNGKFDYYLSTIRFQNHFPEGFGVTNLPDSQDTAVKLNYYPDPNNTVTAFYAHGLEAYFRGEYGNLKIQQNDGNAAVSNDPNAYEDHDVQHYDIGYVSARHKFSQKSFINYRYYRQFGTLDRHLEVIANQYRKSDFTNEGHQLDYQNQLSQTFRLNAGVYYLPSTTNYHVIDQVTAAFNDPAFRARGYRDRTSLINLAETDLYLQGQLKPSGDKLTIDLGGRYASRGYRNLKRISAFTDTYFDPRLGVAYSPTRDLQFHTSATRFSQFPETRYNEYDPPTLTNGVFRSTAKDPTAQDAYVLSHYSPNRLKPYYSENFDLGVDKAFKAFGDNYAVSLTGFSKKQYDLLTENLGSYTSGNPYPIKYDNSGRGQATGAEFVFSKKPRNDYDINGYVSYTNQVARATSSAFDTAYEPYFGTFVTDPTLTNADFLRFNGREFSPSYDQRHTVAAVVSKRFSHLLGTSIVLDAGSGFPFNAGVASDGSYGNVDANHGEKLVGNSADFTEVPVLLTNGSTLSPLNPVIGRSGWHYKISLNTDIFLTPDTNLFFNVDNVFDRLTATVISTTDANGQIYYSSPTAEQPQGHIYYGRGAGSTTPIFLSFGFRHKF